MDDFWRYFSHSIFVFLPVFIVKEIVQILVYVPIHNKSYPSIGVTPFAKSILIMFTPYNYFDM